MRFNRMHKSPCSLAMFINQKYFILCYLAVSDRLVPYFPDTRPLHAKHSDLQGVPKSILNTRYSKKKFVFSQHTVCTGCSVKIVFFLKLL